MASTANDLPVPLFLFPFIPPSRVCSAPGD